MRVIKKRGFYCYSIKYRISARRVIENDNYVGLFNTNNYEELEEKVTALLQDKSISLPNLENCKLSRIDFCINAYLDNQEQVKAYIRTAKRAKLPGRLDEYMVYDKKSKRTKPTKDDFTAYSSEYVAISIYNKYAEMKKEKSFPESEVEKAKNIVRIEIRCMKEKVNAIERKYKIRTIERFMERADEIGNKLYTYYLPKMFGTGEICTLKQVKENIDMGELRSNTIKLMKEFIEYSNESRSVAKAYDFYKQALGKSGTKRLLYLFDLIDTNYVTITNKDYKIFGNQYIPTPMDLYNDFKDEE